MPKYDWNRSRKPGSGSSVVNHSAVRFPADPSDRVRIGRLLSSVRYPGWTFATGDDAGKFEAFRSGEAIPGGPGRLQRLGPWSVPKDAGRDEVWAAVLDAVASVDGEAARDHVRFLPQKVATP